MLDLSALRRGEEVIATVPFDGGSKLDIKYMSREEVVRLREDATEEIYVNHLPQKKVNRDKFYRLLCHAALKGWHDIMVDAEPLEFTPDNIDFMFDKFTGFDEYVVKIAESWVTIEAYRLAESKKKLKSG